MANDGTGVARIYFEKFMSSPGDLTVADHIMAPDVVFHPPISPDPVRGIDEYKKFALHWYEGFPDRVFTLRDAVEQGDKVAAVFRITGTHKGMFMGAAATGNTIEVNGVNIFVFENGKIKDVRVFFNPNDLYGPLGIKG